MLLILQLFQQQNFLYFYSIKKYYKAKYRITLTKRATLRYYDDDTMREQKL